MAESPVERVRAVEVTAALSLATDLQLALDLEHGLRSTVFAVRIGEALGVDRATLADTFHACLLLYVGCTADVHVRAQIFDDIELASQNLFPVMFGTKRELLGALARSIAPQRAPLTRAAEIARGIPRAARVMPVVDVACREVAGMLSDRLGLPASVQALAPSIDERWDRSGEPGLVGGAEVPLPIRIAHVARDADLQLSLGGVERAARVLRARAGHAFDPEIAGLAADRAHELFSLDARQLGMGGGAGLRTSARSHARGPGDRPRAGRDGRLRGSRVALSLRPLSRRRSARHRQRRVRAGWTPARHTPCTAPPWSTTSGAPPFPRRSGRSRAH